MPDAHILQPVDAHRLDCLAFQPVARGFDPGSLPTVPALVKQAVSLPRHDREMLGFRERRGGGLFHQHVELCRQCVGEKRDPADRRRTNRDRLDPEIRRHHLGNRVERRDPDPVGRPTRHGGNIVKVGIGEDVRDMLVACDLADPGNGDAGHSARTVANDGSAEERVLRSVIRNGAASISNRSPSFVVTPSAKLSVAVPKKWTWTSPGRLNWAYLK